MRRLAAHERPGTCLPVIFAVRVVDFISYVLRIGRWGRAYRKQLRRAARRQLGTNLATQSKTSDESVNMPLPTLPAPKPTSIIFFESFCRVKNLSLTGKLCEKLVDVLVVAWPELRVARRRHFLGFAF